ncbi:MAG: ATP-binding protein [Actinobacteria bacterium]|nr:ATP-binding protein [Actinomycetota bacterium]
MEDSTPDIEQRNLQVRVAIYDSMTSAPRIIDLYSDNIRDLMDMLSEKTYNFSQQKGGKIPYTTIREVIENLIHANFDEVTINIYGNGNVITISDQGPGISDKEKVFMPGYTTATKSMKKYIRGVGSGLPIVKETMVFSGGEVKVDDNLNHGTVITLKIPIKDKSIEETVTVKQQPADEPLPAVKISARQLRVLSLIIELEKAGPSKISEELDISLATAYRDLQALENVGFIKPDEQGKRFVTDIGLSFIDRTYNKKV